MGDIGCTKNWKLINVCTHYEWNQQVADKNAEKDFTVALTLFF